MRIEWTPKGGEFDGRTYKGTVDASGYVHWDKVDDSDLVTLSWLRKVAAEGQGTLKESEK